MVTPLQRSLLKTLAYFDTFDFPLTAEEIYRWLWAYQGEVDMQRIRIELLQLAEQKKINKEQSFYCLPGRHAIILKRQEAVPLVKKKMEIARKAGNLIRYVPYVDAMYVCNTVAGAVPHEKSDIDVFIVIRPGRLWMTRALITILFSLFRIRRTKTQVHNRICLSFYITGGSANLSGITWGSPDIYLMYWVDQLVPVYDPGNMLQHIYEQNGWVKKWIPHGLHASIPHPRFSAQKNTTSSLVRRFAEALCAGFLGEYAEKILRQWQRQKMHANMESVLKRNDSRVVVHDAMLKFHENDRREYFRQRWKDRCFELNI